MWVSRRRLRGPLEVRRALVDDLGRHRAPGLNTGKSRAVSTSTCARLRVCWRLIFKRPTRDEGEAGDDVSLSVGEVDDQVLVDHHRQGRARLSCTQKLDQ